MVQDPICVGDVRKSHVISVEDELVIQNLMHGLTLPFPTPKFMSLPSPELKRGGVELIMASCILLASLV